MLILKITLEKLATNSVQSKYSAISFKAKMLESC